MKKVKSEITFEQRLLNASSEENTIVDILSAVLEGLAGVVGPNTEVILHDMRIPERSTVALVNGHVTKRQLGDPIIAAPVDDKGFALVLNKQAPTAGMTVAVSHYRSHTKDGRDLSSATVLLRNAEGRPFASVCANTDLTDYELIFAGLRNLLQPRELVNSAKEADRPTIDELMEEIVNEAVQRVGVPVVTMDKSEKLKIILDVSARGLFLIKGSVERTARLLGVTRYTIYNYLEELGLPRGDKPSGTGVTKSVTKKATQSKRIRPAPSRD